jgi:hypothetical protein
MMQKRVVAECCSMILRSAACASIVIESASSRMQICRGGTFVRPSGLLGYLPLRKFLDLFTDHRDTALIGCVQLNNSLLEKIVSKEILRQSQNGWGFTCTRGSIEHQMRDLSCEHTLPQRWDYLSLVRDLINLGRTIFFNPGSEFGLLLKEDRGSCLILHIVICSLGGGVDLVSSRCLRLLCEKLVH